MSTLAGRGVEDRRRHGVGLRLVRPGRSTSSTTAPAIRGRGIPSSGPATTSGRRASSRASPATGEARWYYQMSPHDLHDYDGVNENVLVDLADRRAHAQGAACIPIATATSTCSIARPARCCRPTPFVPSRRRPASTSRPARCTYNPDKDPQRRRDDRATSARRRPAARTGSRRRGRRARSCSTSRTRTSARTRRPTQVELHRGHAVRRRGRARCMPGPGGHRGEFTAWDPVARQEGVGDQARTFRCGAARSSPPATSSSTARWTAGSRPSTRTTGKLLWQFKTGSGIIGQPISYRGPDGKQYVAVLSGVGGWAGAIVAGDLDPRDATAALGFVNAMKDLQRQDDEGGHALCLRAALSGSAAARGALALASRVSAVALAALPGASGGPLRVCADPDNLPFSTRDAAGFENRIARAASPTSSAPTLRFDWLAAAARLRAQDDGRGACDVLIGVPAGSFERADDAPRTTAPATSFVWRADARAARSARSTIRAAHGCTSACSSSATTSPPRRPATRSRGAASTDNVVGFRSSATRPCAERMVAGARRRHARRRARLGRRRPATSRSDRHSRGARCAPARDDAPASRSSSSRSRWAVRRDDVALRDALDAALERRAATSTRSSREYAVSRDARGLEAPRVATAMMRARLRRRALALLALAALRARGAATSSSRRSAAKRRQPRAAVPTSQPGGPAPARRRRQQSATRRTRTRSPRASGCSAGSTATAATRTAAAAWARADGRRLDLRQRAGQHLATIVEGRPNGMPSFGGRIPDEQVWQLVAYVRSMSGQVREGRRAEPRRRDQLAAAGERASRRPSRATRRCPRRRSTHDGACRTPARGRGRRAWLAGAAASRRAAQSALDPAGPQAAHIQSLWNLMLGALHAGVRAGRRGSAWSRCCAVGTRDADVARRSPTSRQRARRLTRNVGVATACRSSGCSRCSSASVVTDRALARLPLEDALHIEITGHQWWWEVRYDDARRVEDLHTANELHVPVGRPVVVTLKARRRDPQLLGAEPARQEGPDSRAARRTIACAPTSPASIAASAPSSAATSTRSWRFYVIADAARRVRALGGSAARDAAPSRPTRRRSAGRSVFLGATLRDVPRGAAARRRTARTRAGPHARREPPHARRRHAAQHAGQPRAAGSPTRSASSRAPTCRRAAAARARLERAASPTWGR